MDIHEKKIIIFMPSIDGGGVEKNLFIIANFLSKKIKDLTVITFNNKFNSNFREGIKIINVEKRSIKIYSKYYKYLRCLWLLYKEIKKKKCLVLAFQANIYCCLLSLILRFNLITRSNSSPTGWSKNKIKNLIFKFLLKIPKKVIVNSLDFKKEIDRKFNIKSQTIYNPFNLKEVKKLSRKKVNINFFKNSYIKAINVARFTDQKDHITLLRSISILKKKNIKIKLLILGYGPNRNKMLNFIKNNQLLDYVKIINFKKNPYKYINQSNLFLLSSTYEGLPNVLLEAMCLKKFIISSNCPTGPKEILKNGKLGMLFPCKNEKILAKKIMQYISNKKKYNNITLKAYKTLNRFDYNLNCQKYLKVVKEFI